MDEEIIIINDEKFYRISNGTSYDYAPIPKAFKPYFKRLEQEITKLKGVIETYEILIKANNINNWNELKKWLETIIEDLEKSQTLRFNHSIDFKLKAFKNSLYKMQELENRKV